MGWSLPLKEGEGNEWQKNDKSKKKKKLEKQGIDPCASRMLSERSTI